MRNLFILIFLIIIAMSIKASNIAGLELTDLSLEYEHSVGTNREVYWNNKHGEKRGELNLNIQVMYEQLYHKLRVESNIGENQFSQVALDTEFGYKFIPVDLYMKHRSLHLLDRRLKQKYPNENALGIRLRIFGE